jgi:uncharacterized membrane protein YgcG
VRILTVHKSPVNYLEAFTAATSAEASNLSLQVMDQMAPKEFGVKGLFAFHAVRSATATKDRECWNCGKTGHLARDCNSPAAAQSSHRGRGSSSRGSGRGGTRKYNRGARRGGGSRGGSSRPRGGSRGGPAVHHLDGEEEETQDYRDGEERYEEDDRSGN